MATLDTRTAGMSVAALAVKAQLFADEASAAKVILEGGLTLNLQRVLDPHALLVQSAHILPNALTLLRLGKRRSALVKWIDT